MDIITINALSKSYKSKKALDNVSLAIKEGELFGLLGVNGAGKTTLIKILCGLSKKNSGDISINGFNLDEEMDKIKEIIDVSPQETSVANNLTVKENLEYALSNDCLGDDKDKTINKYLELTEISHLKNKKANTLSGGEAQRVSLARAFCYPSNTILCDEPFSSLDLGLKKRIMGVYNDLIKASPRTSIMVTHTIDEALFLADVIIYLDNNTFKRFENPTPRALRNFGYEADNTLRKTLNDLFS